MIQNQIKEQSLKVKMCGMRRKEDIAYANEVKPDAIGYIFFSKSKRYVTGQQARELDQNLDQKMSEYSSMKQLRKLQKSPMKFH